MAKWFALQTIDSNGYSNKPSQSSVLWLRNRFDFDQIFSRKQTYSACILIGWKCSIAIDIGFGGLHAEHRPDDGCHINPSITLFGYAIFMLCVCRFFLLLQTPFASHFYAFYQSISINSNSLCHICFGGLFGLEKSKHFGIKFSDDDLFFFSLFVSISFWAIPLFKYELIRYSNLSKNKIHHSNGRYPLSFR